MSTTCGSLEAFDTERRICTLIRSAPTREHISVKIQIQSETDFSSGLRDVLPSEQPDALQVSSGARLSCSSSEAQKRTMFVKNDSHSPVLFHWFTRLAEGRSVFIRFYI